MTTSVDGKWNHLSNTIATLFYRKPEITNQEIISYLKEEQFITRPSSGLIPYLDQTRARLLNSLKTTPDEFSSGPVDDTPIGSNPFMTGDSYQFYI